MSAKVSEQELLANELLDKQTLWALQLDPLAATISHA